MAMKVDAIFSSLGLNVSDMEFWNRSRLSKPKSTNLSCVPKAVNLYDTHTRYFWRFEYTLKENFKWPTLF